MITVQNTDIERYSRTPIPPCVMASPAMELQLGVFWLLADHTLRKNAKKMHPRSSHTVQHFTSVYFHAQTAVHMHLTNLSYFDREKNQNTPNLSPMSQ